MKDIIFFYFFYFFGGMISSVTNKQVNLVIALQERRYDSFHKGTIIRKFMADLDYTEQAAQSYLTFIFPFCFITIKKVNLTPYNMGPLKPEFGKNTIE